MQENIKELYQKDYLTQKDIIQLLLHNAQHMVTRDELKEDNRELKNELKEDIYKLDLKIESVKKELKEDISNLRSELKGDIQKLDSKINAVRSELKEDISNLRSELKGDIQKLDSKINAVRSELKEDIKNLDNKIDKVNAKFDRLQWFLVASVLAILFKEKLIVLFNMIFG